MLSGIAERLPQGADSLRSLIDRCEGCCPPLDRRIHFDFAVNLPIDVDHQALDMQEYDESGPCESQNSAHRVLKLISLSR